MSISSASATTEVFEMGRVLRRTFGAIGRNPAVFIGLAVVLSALPHLAGGLWRAIAGALDSGTPVVVVSAVSILLSLIGGALLNVAVTRATLIDLADGRPDFAACLKAAIAMLLPMIGLVIVGYLGLILATLLLVVPGIMLYVAWTVVVPAYVQERVGIIASFERSRALTEGARWKIFALLLVWWIAATVLQAPGVWLSGALSGVFQAAPRFPAAPSYLQVLVSSVVAPVTSTVLLALQAAIYVELRDIKEGASSSDLQTIFA